MAYEQTTDIQTTELLRPVSLPGLTGLRGVGAMSVVIYHAQYGMHLPIADAGYLGVDLFFILSGFVLSHAHPETRWSWIRYRSFLRTRIARIFPMHWAGLALVGLVLVLYPKVYSDMPGRFQWSELISSLLLIQNWGWGRALVWNIPSWSLSTEWMVSIAFPLFIIPARCVIRPVLAALLCAVCLGAFAVFLVITNYPDPNVAAKAGIVRTVCEFAAGCFLYRIYAAGLIVSAEVALSGAALIVAGLLFAPLALLTVFGFPVMILLATQSSNPIAAVLSSPVLVFLGEISYSIYLLHWILLQVSDRLQLALHIHGVTALAWFFCFVTLVIVLSTATYHSIELPARRLLRGRRVASRKLLTA